jgi:transcription elongation factor GreA
LFEQEERSGDGAAADESSRRIPFPAADFNRAKQPKDCLSAWSLDMDRFPMTPGGLAKLQEELKRLKSDERPSIIRAIAEAREHGDLSENAEYHAAKERQSFVEGRIAELEDKTSRAEVIDPSTMSGNTVRFGATVKVVDEESEAETEYQIVGADEAAIENGRISITSPIARAMIGKTIGDQIEVQAPGGARYYEILDVGYR